MLKPMRPKARRQTQQGGRPGWLEESDQAGCDSVRDERSMPPALTHRTAGPCLGLCSCEILANPAAVVDVLVLNEHKHRQELYHARQAWVKTLVRPLTSP